MPAMVTVLSGAQVNNYRLQDARDLLTMVPTAFMQEINAGTARDINIRGVGTPNLFAESGVAMYVDDVFSSDFISYPTQFYDLDRMEVLQGPQGGLYGRNAVGGVVNFISHQPDDQYEGYVRAAYGNYNRYELEGMANIPIGQDLGVRIVGWRPYRSDARRVFQRIPPPIHRRQQLRWRSHRHSGDPDRQSHAEPRGRGVGSQHAGDQPVLSGDGETMTTIMRDTQPTNHYSTGAWPARPTTRPPPASSP